MKSAMHPRQTENGRRNRVAKKVENAGVRTRRDGPSPGSTGEGGGRGSFFELEMGLAPESLWSKMDRDECLKILERGE